MSIESKFGYAQSLRDDTEIAKLRLRLNETKHWVNADNVERVGLECRIALLELVHIAVPVSVEIVKYSIRKAARSGENTFTTNWQTKVRGNNDVDGFIFESYEGPGMYNVCSKDMKHRNILTGGHFTLARDLIEAVSSRTASAIQSLDEDNLVVVNTATITQPVDEPAARLFTFNRSMTVEW